MRRSLPIAFVLALGLVPTMISAQTYRAFNTLTVQVTGPETFQVLYKGGALDHAYWCAAADFVIHGLGKSSRTRLFRASPTPRKQAQGVAFTLDPAGATRRNGLTVFGSPDGTVSAGHARSTFCDFNPFYGFP